MTGRHGTGELSAWAEALRDRQQAQLDVANERIAGDPDRPRLKQDEYFDKLGPRFRRWVWEVINTTTGDVLATGRAWTKKAAIRRKHRAFDEQIAILLDGRAEA